MQQTFLRRPSPALVVACAALLAALGGTGIAAVTAVPNNSVGTAQLKSSAVTNAKIANDAVTAAKVKNGQITASDLASNAVTTAKLANEAVTEAKLGKSSVTSTEVKDHSLYKQDFAPGQIPAGPAGTVGKLTLQSTSVSVAAGNSSEVTARCSTGQAVSGGATWADKGDLALTLVYSNPVYDSAAGKATGWVARGRNSTGKSRQFTVQVLCGKA
jgi:hypothetical protein